MWKEKNPNLPDHERPCCAQSRSPDSLSVQLIAACPREGPPLPLWWAYQGRTLSFKTLRVPGLERNAQCLCCCHCHPDSLSNLGFFMYSLLAACPRLFPASFGSDSTVWTTGHSRAHEICMGHKQLPNQSSHLSGKESDVWEWQNLWAQVSGGVKRDHQLKIASVYVTHFPSFSLSPSPSFFLLKKHSWF